MTQEVRLSSHVLYLEGLLSVWAFRDSHDFRSCHADVVFQVHCWWVNLDGRARVLGEGVGHFLCARHVRALRNADENLAT